MAISDNDDGGRAQAPAGLANAEGLPLAYAPIITEMFFTAAIKFGFDMLSTGMEAGVGAGLSRLKEINPLPHRVVASWYNSNIKRYCCCLEFLNLTGHGVYLENMFVSVPRNISFSVYSRTTKNEGSIGFDTPLASASTENHLPFYIPSGLQQPKPLIVTLEDDGDGTLSRTGIVTLNCSISVVGGPKSKKTLNEKISFRIRKKGPYYP